MLMFSLNILEFLSSSCEFCDKPQTAEEKRNQYYLRSHVITLSALRIIVIIPDQDGNGEQDPPQN